MLSVRFFAVICFSPALGAALFSAAPAAERSQTPAVKGKAAAERRAYAEPQAQEKPGALTAPGGAWQIEAIKGKRAIPGMDGKAPGIEFSAHSYHGRSGCNGFGGNFEVKGAEVKFSRPASTLMACPERVSRQEYVLFEALPEVRAYRYIMSGHRAKRGEKRKAGNKQALQLLDGKGRAIINLVRK